MKLTLALTLACASVLPSLHAQAASRTSEQASPWTGTWVLNETRSMTGAKGAAADGYRFTIGADNSIKWEIPALAEVVTGKIDGGPMEVHRPTLKVPMTISLTSDGPQVMIYKVTRNGKAEGEGRMTLIENNKHWVDISGPAGKPQFAGMLVYDRQ